MLIFAVLMLVICAIARAISSSRGNISSAVRARTGFLVSIGAAALAGGGVTWVNFLLGIGAELKLLGPERVATHIPSKS